MNIKNNIGLQFIILKFKINNNIDSFYIIIKIGINNNIEIFFRIIKNDYKKYELKNYKNNLK